MYFEQIYTTWKRGYIKEGVNAMIVNHNKNALSALNKLNSSNALAGKAMSKLSSGVRINSTADDSSGASISQKMKAQIRGLEVAGRNIQDGISMINVAEAALGNIQDGHLLRIRDLCVQSINGTLTGEDRTKLQDEVNQIISSIDEIAENTEFNEINLLSPEIIEPVPPYTPGKADVIFVIDRTGSMGSKIEDVKNNIDAFISKMSSNGVEVSMGLISYAEVNSSGDDKNIIKYPITSNIDEFKANLNNITVNGGGDYEESGLEGIMDSANGALSYPLRDGATKQIIMVTDATVHDNSTAGDHKSKFDINDVASTLQANNIKLTVVSDDRTDVKNQYDKLITPTGGQFIDMNSNFSDKLGVFADKIIEDSGSLPIVKDMPILNLQVGPNMGHEFKVELFDARAVSLGIKDISVRNPEAAELALQKIDSAIEMVSAQRSKFGAYSNALEHIYNNVTNYNENITSAESRISDADMAKETLTLSKYSIIEQAAQSMLSQSMKMQESIMNLMEKWGAA